LAEPRRKWFELSALCFSLEGRVLEKVMTVQLAKQESTEYRSVQLHIGSDGTIRMDAHDMGPTVERIWDHEDYEFLVQVPASAVGKLAFELLRDKFSGNLSAVAEFRSFCAERGILHEFYSWP
jgi:hypothetical protein